MGPPCWRSRVITGPTLVPAATLGEIAFLVEERLGIRVLDLLLADLESGAYTLDCGEADLGRTRQLVQRYEGLSLGFVDAAVIACAERSGGRVLTFDLRDFGVVAAEGPSRSCRRRRSRRARSGRSPPWGVRARCPGLLVAESNPAHKELVIRLILNLLADDPG